MVGVWADYLFSSWYLQSKRVYCGKCWNQVKRWSKGLTSFIVGFFSMMKWTLLLLHCLLLLHHSPLLKLPFTSSTQLQWWWSCYFGEFETFALNPKYSSDCSSYCSYTCLFSTTLHWIMLDYCSCGLFEVYWDENETTTFSWMFLS